MLACLVIQRLAWLEQQIDQKSSNRMLKKADLQGRSRGKHRRRACKKSDFFSILFTSVFVSDLQLG